MRTTGNPPAWAVKLVKRVCADYGRSTPHLTWRRSAREFGTSGHYKTWGPNGQEIVITAGSDRWDQKHTLLHELAHRIRPGYAHSADFYETAFNLYRTHDGNIGKHKVREYDYHPRTAKAGYRRSRANLSPKG